MVNYPTAKIEALLVPRQDDDFYTSPLLQATFDLDGMIGDHRHGGRERLADVRIKTYDRNKDLVLNRQQVSMVDSASLDEIANELELGKELNDRASRRLFLARCLGANILFDDFQGTDAIPAFHDLPNATDFGPFDQKKGKFTDATVMIARYNSPCTGPGKKIEQLYPGDSEGLASRFLKAAVDKRGFVGMVIKTGTMSVGQEVAFAPLPTR